MIKIYNMKRYFHHIIIFAIPHYGTSARIPLTIPPFGLACRFAIYGKLGAIFECMLSYACYTIGYGYAQRRGASFESPLSYAGDAFGDGYAR